MQVLTALGSQKKKGAVRLLFPPVPKFFQALDPSVKRNAQTKRLLTGCPLGALKCLRDFTSAGLLPRE